MLSFVSTTDLDELRHFQEYDDKTSSWAKELGNTDSATSIADDQEAAYGSEEGFWTEVYKVLRELLLAERGDNTNTDHENDPESDDDFQSEEEHQVDNGETDQTEEDNNDTFSGEIGDGETNENDADNFIGEIDDGETDENDPGNFIGEIDDDEIEKGNPDVSIGEIDDGQIDDNDHDNFIAEIDDGQIGGNKDHSIITQTARNIVEEDEDDFPYDEAYYFRPFYSENSLVEDRSPVRFASEPKQKNDIL